MLFGSELGRPQTEGTSWPFRAIVRAIQERTGGSGGSLWEERRALSTERETLSSETHHSFTTLATETASASLQLHLASRLGVESST